MRVKLFWVNFLIISACAFCVIFVGNSFNETLMNVEAYTSGYYTYTVSNEEATITGCDTSVTGSITIPSSLGGYEVTGIGETVFQGCIGLESVTIPESVTNIGARAFYGCSGLESVYINDVGAWCGIAFSDMYSNPLYYADKLYLNGILVTDLVIPDGVTDIGDSAFRGCGGLESVTIPDGVTSIGIYAFDGCSGLNRVTIPDSVTSSGICAFSECSGLESVYINDISAWCGITFGNGSANPLYYASELYLNEILVTDLVIPDGVTSIGECAFDGYSGLESVTIPDGVTVIGYGAFGNCSGLKEFIVSSSNSEYLSIDGVLYNKSADILICYPKGKQGAFVVPNSVTRIEDSAFGSCIGLKSVTIPDSVTSIGNRAFDGCSRIESVIIPDGVTDIGFWTFGFCSSLKSVTIPDSVTSIGVGAFEDCNELTDVYFGGAEKSWNRITFHTFNDCLKNATIHFDCKIIPTEDSYFSINSERNLINNISSGTTISDITSQLNSSEGIVVLDINGRELGFDDVIGTGCKLKRVINNVIVDELTAVITGDTDGDGAVTVADTQIAYKYLMGTSTVSDAYAEAAKVNGGSTMSILDIMAILNKIYHEDNSSDDDSSGSAENPIEDGVLSYALLPDGTYGVAADDMAKFKSVIEIPSVHKGVAVTQIMDDGFKSLTTLQSVIIPENIVKIGDNAFSGCSELNTVSLPESLEVIGKKAFYCATALETINIPGNVTEIGGCAFYCTGLKEINILTAKSWKMNNVYRSGADSGFVNITINGTSVEITDVSDSSIKYPSFEFTSNNIAQMLTYGMYVGGYSYSTYLANMISE